MRTAFILLSLSLSLFSVACEEDSETTEVEAGMSAAGTEAGIEAGTEAGTEASAEAGTEAVTEAGTESGTEAGTEAGTVMSTGCGDETFFGRCDGTSLVYCDEPNNSVITVDCAEGNNESISQTCALINDEYGYDCQAEVGSECLIDGGPTLCAGENSGCVLFGNEMTGLTSSCVESLEVCNPESFDGEEDRAVCSGDYLYIGCSIDQPWAFDCAGFGGSCADNACVLPEGQFCDDLTLRCAEGMTCSNLSEEGFGTCAPVMP